MTQHQGRPLSPSPLLTLVPPSHESWLSTVVLFSSREWPVTPMNWLTEPQPPGSPPTPTNTPLVHTPSFGAVHSLWLCIAWLPVNVRRVHDEAGSTGGHYSCVHQLAGLYTFLKARIARLRVGGKHRMKIMNFALLTHNIINHQDNDLWQSCYDHLTYSHSPHLILFISYLKGTTVFT